MTCRNRRSWQYLVEVMFQKVDHPYVSADLLQEGVDSSRVYRYVCERERMVNIRNRDSGEEMGARTMRPTAADQSAQFQRKRVVLQAVDYIVKNISRKNDHVEWCRGSRGMHHALCL